MLIEKAISPGTNVRRPGEDIAAGSEVFTSGTQLRAAHIGVLASLGIQSLLVCPRPTVGVLSTGNELAGPGDVPVPGQIRDANRPALLAQIGAGGFRGIDLGVGADDQDALSDLLTAGASRCDAVVASGGVSVGDHDVLKAALEKLGGATMRSLRVAVKPGKHVAFALLGKQRVPAFGLPGNPVAALVTYELYVRPALRATAGCPVPDRPRITAIAETDLRRRPGPKLHLPRVTARTGPTEYCECDSQAARNRTCCGQWQTPMPSPCCQTATASRPAGLSKCYSSTPKGLDQTVRSLGHEHDSCLRAPGRDAGRFLFSQGKLI